MSEFYELTNDYYLNCTSNCASELAEIRETLISLMRYTLRTYLIRLNYLN